MDDWYHHGRNWSPEAVSALCAAFRAGGALAAVAAFPDRSEGAVRSALRRYVDAPSGEPTAIDIDAVRRRLRDLPLDVFAEGFAALSNRTANFHGAR